MYVPALNRFFSISYIVLLIAPSYIFLAAGEIIDLLLQLLDLPGLPLAEADLLSERLLPLVQLLLLLLDLVVQSLILLAASSELDLDVPEGLLELLDFRPRDPDRLPRLVVLGLLRPHQVPSLIALGDTGEEAGGVDVALVFHFFLNSNILTVILIAKLLYLNSKLFKCKNN
jgi:hypothetical protein